MAEIKDRDRTVGEAMLLLSFELHDCAQLLGNSPEDSFLRLMRIVVEIEGLEMADDHIAELMLQKAVRLMSNVLLPWRAE